MTLLRRLVAVAGLLLVSQAARAQTCPAPTPWRTGLAHACQDAPARASVFNANWWQMVQWVEAKVGTVDQPLVLPNGSLQSAWFAAGAVNTAALADNAVTAAKLADNAVATAKLADGAVTAAKVKGGGVSVFTRSASCSSAGDLTLATTCAYVTAQCGSCGIVPQFRACNGTCPSCTHLAPQTCNAPNTLVGYLVAP